MIEVPPGPHFQALARKSYGVVSGLAMSNCSGDSSISDVAPSVAAAPVESTGLKLSVRVVSWLDSIISGVEAAACAEPRAAGAENAPAPTAATSA